MLSVRKVEEKDIQLLFDWANDPFYRSMSKNSKPILWEHHVDWFNRIALVNPYLYIFCYEGQDLGFVRFDLNKSKDWFITIYLDGKKRGQGLGKAMLLKAVELFGDKDTSDLYAEVNPINQSSLRMFLSCGFNILKEDEFTLLKRSYV